MIGTFSHWKAGNINIPFDLIMLGGAVVGAIIGSLCSDILPQSLYNKLTGMLLLILGVQMLIVYLRKRREKFADEKKANSENKLSGTIKAIIFGFLGGAMSGLMKDRHIP